MFLPDFGERLEAVELMDDPGADPVLLRRTIAQFGSINRLLSRASQRAWSLFSPLMAGDREYSLIDVGAGGCDIVLRLAKRARRAGKRLRILALDRDARIIPWAREATAGFPEIEVRQAEASELRSLGPVDFVISNHLMHHLRRGEIGDLLVAAQGTAKLGFVLDDLRRSPWSWLGYSLYAALFARGSLAFVDGRLSIRRGFTAGELRDIARERLPDGCVRVFTATPGRAGFLRVGESEAC
jgi:2-polyprenyl-3-methyl-5-hydroxy-6-metoxy-1,4-benzoquinol methylase